MDIKATISLAGHKHNTVIITALDEDGSLDSREIEPYGYRYKGNTELFFCYDIDSQVIRSYSLSRIISAQETRNSYDPRREIEL